MEETIGKIPRDKRQELNLTLEEVAAKTAFRKDFLEKLEQDDFSCFKTAVYANGTIRGYGNFLGLDGVALVEQFKSAQLASATFGDGNINQQTIDAVAKSKVNMNLTKEQGLGTQSSFTRDEKPLPIKQIIAGVILVGVLGGGYFLAPQISSSDFTFFDGIKTKAIGFYDTLTNLVAENHEAKQKHEEPKVEPKPQEAAVALKPKETAPAPKPVVKKIDPNAIAARYDKVVVEMTANGQCWIDVFADGKAIYSGMMNKGRYKIFEANKRVTVRYGNIGVMQVIVNGKPVNMRGEGGVATRHYPK